MFKKFKFVRCLGFTALVACSSTLPEVPFELDTTLVTSIPDVAAISYMEEFQSTYYGTLGQFSCRFEEETVTFQQPDFWVENLVDVRTRAYSELVYSISVYPSDGSHNAVIFEPDRGPGVTKGSRQSCLFTPRWGLEGTSLAEVLDERKFEKLAAAFESLGVRRYQTASSDSASGN